MRKTKLTVKPTTAFKKDYKLAIKRGLQIELLEDLSKHLQWEMRCRLKTEIMT